MWKYYVGITSALVAAMAILAWPSSPPASAITKRTFDSFTNFTAELISGGIPVLIQNTPVNHWRAVGLWNSEYFRDQVTHSELYVKKSANPVFLLDNRKESHLPWKVLRNYSMITLPVKDFVGFTEKEKHEHGYLYYAGEILDWPDLIDEIQPTEFLQARPGEDSLSRAMIWLGQAGVTAQAHYDRSYNFFVQVTGTKHWLLFPPSEFPNLYAFPVLHPSYHQSQINFSDPRRALLYPRFNAGKGLEVVLRPGDVLYVPPYWMHRVTSQTFSASVSVLSPSKEEVVCKELVDFWTSGGPQDWDESGRLLWLLKFLARWSESSGRNFDRFVADFIKPRYTLLSSALPPSPPRKVQCSAFRAWPPGTPTWKIEENLGGSVVRFSDLLSQIDRSVADICLANWFENAVAWAVGPEAAAPTLETCWF